MHKDQDSLKQLGATRHEEVLANGLRVVLYERPGMPVTIHATFKAGSRHDTPGKEGLAHIVEHMCVSATKDFPTRELLSAYIETELGRRNAHTSSDLLWLDVHFADGEDMPKAAYVLDQMINYPLFKAQEFKHEKGAVQRELG